MNEDRKNDDAIEQPQQGDGLMPTRLAARDSVAIRRLMDEVQYTGEYPLCMFDRAHNRHNRS